jgi:hypothetical protein
MLQTDYLCETDGCVGESTRLAPPGSGADSSLHAAVPTQFLGGLVVSYRHRERSGQKIAQCIFFLLATEGWHGPE